MTEKVMCRYCGTEMTEYDGTMVNTLKGTMRLRLRCKCGAHSPYGEERNSRKDALVAAHQAAARRPENRVLDYETVYCMTNGEAVWRVDKDNDVRVFGGFDAWQKYNDKRYLYFATKPTQADIHAARGERG